MGDLWHAYDVSPEACRELHEHQQSFGHHVVLLFWAAKALSMICCPISLLSNGKHPIGMMNLLLVSLGHPWLLLGAAI